jgi:hypothetical protein
MGKVNDRQKKLKNTFFCEYSYSLSLVDAIDTLATIGNSTEFARVYTIIQNLDIERDINVSVFETNIRGLILKEKIFV